ncbi:MAG TPA: F0F1 ATP synthase subunit B [Syntrophales bacterium]|nr:F0F1 ATP synthase subunit B [Syntrophales bacterium]
MSAFLNEKRRDKCVRTGLAFIAAFGVLLAGVALASSEGGEGHGPSKIIDFGWRALNFAVLAFLLYKLLWGKIKDFFANRRKGIEASLEEAVRVREEAEKKFKDYSDRLAKATDEITGISDMIKAQGDVEKQKIIEGAKSSADKMKEDAAARMEQDLKKARNDLRKEASELAVRMAEEILKTSVKENDHNLMVKDFMNRMVKH